jgi:hypothetical protein
MVDPVLKVTKLDTVLVVCDDEDNAIEAFVKGAAAKA